MRIFLCEFLTSGGLRHQEIAPDQVALAMLLRDALVRDLEAVPGVTVTLAYDDRLPAEGAPSAPSDPDPCQIALTACLPPRGGRSAAPHPMRPS